MMNFSLMNRPPSNLKSFFIYWVKKSFWKDGIDTVVVLTFITTWRALSLFSLFLKITKSCFTCQQCYPSPPKTHNRCSFVFLCDDNSNESLFKGWTQKAHWQWHCQHHLFGRGFSGRCCQIPASISQISLHSHSCCGLLHQRNRCLHLNCVFWWKRAAFRTTTFQYMHQPRTFPKTTAYKMHQWWKGNVRQLLFLCSHFFKAPINYACVRRLLR